MDDGAYRQRRMSDDSIRSESPVLEEDADGGELNVDDFYSPPASPGKLSRNPSFSNTSSYQEDWETFPPLDKLSIFDLLDNFSLTQRLEKWQQSLNLQREKVKKQQEKLKSTSALAKDRVMGEWKKRVPTAEEQLDKYRKRMKHGVERLGRRWNDTATVTLWEKISFIAGVVNIFISGYLIGAYPDYFYIWYSLQLAYFMPIRYYNYHKKGWHYFLADLCYFVNLLCILSIWIFPQSKRLFISTFCLTFGNNAIAIALWRNSLVFHSHDKVVSVFIHIMPPAALHCIVHLTSPARLKERFPAVYDIKFSDPESPEHYSLLSMIVWATLPYIVWQISYYVFITVRRAEKIAAGRLTSFTWLRKSYAKTWIGKIVLNLPESLQEPVFMLIQYAYAMLTMIPCPIWFWSHWACSAFMMTMFVWSVHNGATYYIDIFGKRFQKELEELKKDVAQWQSSPESATTPLIEPSNPSPTKMPPPDVSAESEKAIDQIPSLESTMSSTGAQHLDSPEDSVMRERR